MNKKLLFVSISLVGILVLPTFSLGQTQNTTFSQIDCSQYTSQQEKLMCTFFNTMLQLYMLLLQQLQAKITNQPVQPIQPTEPVQPNQPSIKVLSPNGGEKWEIGKTYKIIWQQSQDTPVSIGIENNLLLPLPNSDSVFYRKSISGMFNGKTGRNEYSWTISTDISSASGYKICIGGYFSGNSNVRPVLEEDCSDAPFSVVSQTNQPQPSITILSPSNNQILTSPINISWKENPMSANANFSIEIKALESNYYSQGTVVFSTSTKGYPTCPTINYPYSGSDVCFYSYPSISLLPGKYSLMITDNNVKGGVSNSVVFEVRETYAVLSYFYAWPTLLNSGDTTNFQFGGKNISYYNLNFNCSVAVIGIYNNAPDVCNTTQRISGSDSNFPVQFINDGTYPSNVTATLSAYDSNNKLVDTRSVTVIVNPKSYSLPTLPSLSINKTSFLTTDTWQLRLTNALPGQQVYICAIDNQGNQSCTPAQNLGFQAITDLFGNWSASGSWNGNESVVGTWKEWIVVGGTLQGNQVIGGTKSNEIQFTISKPKSSMLESLNQMANMLNSLNSVLNLFR